MEKKKKPTINFIKISDIVGIIDCYEAETKFQAND